MSRKRKFITLVGFANLHGQNVFNLGTILKLVKEPDNKYDDEAIYAEIRHVGKAAYVANSTQTVVRGTMSAGRLYDKIDDVGFAEVKFIATNLIIAKILSEKKISKLKDDPDSDLYYLMGD